MTRQTLAADLYKLAVEQNARYFPATYTMNANGDSNNQTYSFRPQSGRGPFVCLGMELPADDAFVDIRSGGIEYTDGQALARAFMDVRDDVASQAAPGPDANPGKLPAPVIVDEQSLLRIKASSVVGGTLKTDGLVVWGFHTNREFAQFIRETGEFNGVSLDTGELTAAGTFTRQSFTLDWNTWYHYAYESLNIGGEDGALIPDDLRVDLGELELHPDGSGLLPDCQPQKAGAWCGIELGVGAQVILRGSVQGEPGQGRVTVTLVGRRVYTKKRGSRRGGMGLG